LAGTYFLGALSAALLVFGAEGGASVEPTFLETSTAAPLMRPAATLPSGTVVYVMLDSDIETATAQVGDEFTVSVIGEIARNGTVVIPQCAAGEGHVTFVSKRGAFGRSGIVQIALDHLELGDRQVALDGHYRETGKSKGDEAAAAYFWVGPLAAVIKGKKGGIPQGRILKARTGEDIAFEPTGNASQSESAAQITPADDENSGEGGVALAEIPVCNEGNTP